MKSIDREKLVEEIKKEESSLYGIDFDLETPTIVEYYIDHLKKGDFNLVKNTKSNFFIHTILGLSDGFTTDKGITVINADKGFSNFLSLSLEEVSKSLPLDKIFTVQTTYHEIRHVLQRNGLVPLYFYFCRYRLSSYDVATYLSNAKHDKLFSEIDADIYGFFKTRFYFDGDETIEKYIDKFLGPLITKINVYDFDAELENYQKCVEEKGISDYFICDEVAWKPSGEFKTPKEVFANENFSDCFEHICSDELYIRIFASDAYLSRININNLSSEEIDFLNEMLIKNIYILDLNKVNIYKEYIAKRIPEELFVSSIKELDKRIKKKEELRKQLVISNHKESNENAYKRIIEANKANDNTKGVMWKNTVNKGWFKRNLANGRHFEIGKDDQVRSRMQEKIDIAVKKEESKKIKEKTSITEALKNKIKNPESLKIIDISSALFFASLPPSAFIYYDFAMPAGPILNLVAFLGGSMILSKVLDHNDNRENKK